MKKIFRSFLITALFIFVLGYANVYAESFGEGDRCLNFDFNGNGYESSVKINNHAWTSKNDEFRTSNGNYEIIILAGKKGDSFPWLSTPGGFDTPDNVTVDSRPNPNDDPNVQGDEYKFTITLTNYGKENGCEFLGGPELVDGPEATVPFHDEETEITFSISGEELEYHYVADKPDEADVTYFKFAINSMISDDLVPFTFGNAKYTYIDGKEPPKNVSKAETKQPINYHYRYDDSGKVEFCVNGSATDEYTKIMINGVDYADQAPHTQREVFENFGGQTSTQFCIKNVPYAAKYNVVVEGKGVTDDKKIAGFAWSYLTKDRSPDIDHEGDFAHGKLEFVKAKFTDDEGTVYEFDSASKYNAGRYHETGEIFQWANGDKNYPEEDRRMAGGNVLAPYGTELTIRIVPDAGYQLTSMTTSPNGFQATNEVGVYKINLTRENLKFNDGEFKLEPTFTKIGSEVESASEKVASGTIETDEKVENGSLKLAVTDANISNERKTAFEEKAAEEGYTVSNIVDISLYNSIYKGGKKDANGHYLSWDKEVNNLNKKANIGLKLQDDMSGKQVALVHETHEGDKVTGYELVDASYDSESNIVSFEEDSFSNFAIVVKDNNEEPTSGEKEMVRVDFDTRAEKGMDPVEIEKGSKVNKPEDPTNGDNLFVGWFTDEECENEFDFNTPINENITLIAKWSDKVQTYNVSDNKGNTVTFNEIKDRAYTLTMIDIIPMTDDELKQIDATRAEYNEAMKKVLKVTDKYGKLISFYQIMIIDKEDDHEIHDGPIKIKIKLTEEMKKYDSFMLMYFDEEFKNEDPIELKVEGDYLVGTLPHLSAYALVGNSKLPDVPKTGDNIYTWVIIMLVSLISLSVGAYKVIKQK